jgi:hypothetical protein
MTHCPCGFGKKAVTERYEGRNEREREREKKRERERIH